jgi:Domain of unknown function (DUF4062)/SIR2-like domain
MARIYVSSTFKDLKECREKVRIVLKRMGHEDIAMEYYVAGDERPLDKCLKDVASSDLYIGIFAWRYGFVPDGYDKSVTELEYRKAKESGKKCLIFLLNEEAPWPRNFIDKGEDQEKIAALRFELSTEYIVNFFYSADELASLVGTSVYNWTKENSQVSSDISSLKTNPKIGEVSPRDSGSEVIEWRDNNLIYIDELKKSYNKNGLVLFLGAGVSLSAGMPDWEMLISKLIVNMIGEELPNGLDTSEDEIQIISNELQKIHGFSPILAARYVRSSLTDKFDEKIYDNLYTEADKTGIVTSELLDSLVKLCMPKRNGPGIKAVVNYNFDDLLEAHLKKISIRCNPVCTHSYYVEPDQLPIYHVHGFLPRNEKDYRIPKGFLVFSEEGYHNLMQDTYYWSNIVQLNCFLESTCLMVGLSVTDPNLRRLLDVAAKNTNMPKHYVLLKRLLFSDVLDRYKEKEFRANVIKAFISKHHELQEKSFEKLGLNIIWFEKFDEIPRIIDKIRD